MKFKLDENFGRQAVAILVGAGHDVATVSEEGLTGADDTRVFAASIAEGRVLVTLDHDFGNVLRFNAEQSAGIVVIELPPGQSPASMAAGLVTMLAALKDHRLDKTLWIVEPGRVRIHQREDLD